jgi:drug/metabolite transporter (DMT)-like permease
MSSFTFLTPLFALAFGVTVLGEPLTLRLVLALAGVGLGIMMVNRRNAPAGAKKAASRAA